MVLSSLPYGRKITGISRYFQIEWESANMYGTGEDQPPSRFQLRTVSPQKFFNEVNDIAFGLQLHKVATRPARRTLEKQQKYLVDGQAEFRQKRPARASQTAL